MAIQTKCANCNAEQALPDDAVGKSANCTRCGAQFIVAVPVKKICCRCGKDVSQINRCKDQFGNYYCEDCIHAIRQAEAAAAQPARPASQPVTTASERDDLALSQGAPGAAEPALAASPPVPEESRRFAAQVVFRPAKTIQWPQRCVGCFGENPQQTMKLSVAPATELGSGTKMGRLKNIVLGLTMRLKRSGRLETGHYSLPICDDCCGKLSTEDVGGLAGQADDAQPPPYRVLTPLMTREIEQKCVVLSFSCQEYADAFRQANQALVSDSVEACVAATQKKPEPPPPPAEAPAEAPAQASAEAPAVAPAEELQPQAVLPGLAESAAPPKSSGRPAARGATPETIFLMRSPDVLPQAPRLAQTEATPPALPPLPSQAGQPAPLPAKVETEQRQALPFPSEEPAAQPAAPAAVPPAARVAPVEEQILELLQSQPRIGGLHVTPDIAPDMLAGVTLACLVPNSECVLAVLDCTASGTAENALVFGCMGVYYCNAPGSKSAGSGAIGYTEFPRRVFGNAGAGEVALDHEQFLNVSGCPLGAEKVIALLQGVQKCAVRTARPPVPSSPPPPPSPNPLPLHAPPLRDDLRQLAKTHLPDGPVKALGAAAWEPEGTLGAKIGSFLTGRNTSAPPKEYHVGLIAVIADKLFVVELGKAADSAITLDGLKQMGPPKVDSYRLRGLKVECLQSETQGLLELHGAVEIKAIFPISCGADNPSRAGDIAMAIRCA